MATGALDFNWNVSSGEPFSSVTVASVTVACFPDWSIILVIVEPGKRSAETTRVLSKPSSTTSSAFALTTPMKSPPLWPT